MVRPTLLRQAFNAAPAKRLSTQTAYQLRTASPLAHLPLRSSFVRGALPQATRIAAFHVTARRPILPALPQKVEGTVNDPAIIPHTSHLHGSYHWTFERYLRDFLASIEQLLIFLGLD
jgi:succinate dehydrogenase (ubiquinone) membrane anchor subunit